MDKKEILNKVEKLISMHKNGELGGEIMPEDANPHLEKGGPENYLYFTLPMALNYQRNSYTLWESALKTYEDEETRFVFSPKVCLEKSFEEVQYALTKYKVDVIEAWSRLFENTQYKPINIHTPLWLWSRNGFKDIK